MGYISLREVALEANISDRQRCYVCGKHFVPRFSFQRKTKAGRPYYFCSQECLLKVGGKAGSATCSVCGKGFVPAYAYQQAIVDGETRHYCSEACADSYRVEMVKKRGVRRVAVVNQKGGTGKTTTAINFSAGLAARGLRVLLIDMDAQGNVGISLGLHGEKGTYHLLMDACSAADCAVPIRDNLDIITSNASLAAAEISLATAENRERVLKTALARAGGEERYDYVVLDCPPSLSLVNQNALVYARRILVPVSCDFLAMVGVKQILRTVSNMNSIMGEEVSIQGVLPTFYDKRTRLSDEVLENLKDYFKDKLLPPIRISTRLKEAPIHKKTIFEYDPNGHAAADYLAMVDRFLAS